MGSYESLGAGMAVLEMRGYSQKCKIQLRMDEPVVDWVKEEITAALTNWTISKSIKRMVKGNIEGSFAVIDKAQKRTIDLEKIKEHLNLATTRTYHDSVTRSIETLGSIEELDSLKSEYLKLLQLLEEKADLSNRERKRPRD